VEGQDSVSDTITFLAQFKWNSNPWFCLRSGSLFGDFGCEVVMLICTSVAIIGR
jgi:hypothetical protein